MSDLISRQAAIDAFTGVVILEPAQSAKKYIDGVIERIQNLTSAQPEQRWIPVSEKLPEPWKPVLWTGKNGNIYIKPFDGSFIENIAWMPLPEPYKEERREEPIGCEMCKHNEVVWPGKPCFYCNGYGNYFERREDD